MFKTADNSPDNKVDLTGGVNLDKIGEKVETKPIEESIDLDKFFAGIDEKFNGAIFSEETATPEEGPVAEVTKSSSDTGAPDPTELQKELDSLKQRYSDSSREAKRLAEQNKQLEQYADYVPILETMREDPGLINHVRDYLEGNSTPKSIKEELGLSDEFFFDSDEAITDPNSESAKVMDTMISKGVEKRLAEQQQVAAEHQRITTAQRTQEEELSRFREEAKMSEEEYDRFIDFAKNTKLTPKDIYFLMNREDRERNIAQKAIEEQGKKLKEMRGQPRSIASAGSSSEPVSEDRQVFNAIHNASQTANIFDEGE